MPGPEISPGTRVAAPDDPLEASAERQVDRVLGGWTPALEPGAPSASGVRLAPRLRTFFEARFGEDFGQVEIRADAAAARSAAAVSARAYTSGNRITFGAGRYAPHTLPGRRLLAHELAHVVQQRRLGLRGVIQRAAVQYTEVVADTDPAAAAMLNRFDQAVASINQRVGTISGPQLADLQAAAARLQALRQAGKVKVWRMVTMPPVYATYHGASGQIRLNLSYPDQAVDPGTLVHEAIHAVHAQRHPEIAAAYGKGLASGVPVGNTAMVLLAFKWKAWTEYWAYRRQFEFNAPQQASADPRAAHRFAILNADVRVSLQQARAAGDPQFDPETWQPSAADQQTAKRFTGTHP